MTSWLTTSFMTWFQKSAFSDSENAESVWTGQNAQDLCVFTKESFVWTGP